MLCGQGRFAKRCPDISCYGAEVTQSMLACKDANYADCYNPILVLIYMPGCGL